MPVLPLVGSMITVSGPILPAASAASIMAHADAVLDAAGRVEELQLEQDLGQAPVSCDRFRRTSGVLPISSVMLL